MYNRQIQLVLTMILLLAIPLSGCLGCSPKSNIFAGSPTITATPQALPLVIDPVTPISEEIVTTVPGPNNEEPDVTTNENGYTIKSSGETAGTAPLELNAGKTSFRLKLENYHAGDTYTMVLTSVNEPFSYKSTHEFAVDSGAGDIRITKNIPMEGSYQIKLDYPFNWEIEVTQ